MQFLTSSKRNDGIHARQIAFFGAFILPLSKMVEAPSLLAKSAMGDLLLPAILHSLLQAGILALVLLALSRLDKPLVDIIDSLLGKWKWAIYLPYALFFLFFAVLPLLDLEKFVYAVFYDTPPTLFSFLFFFPVCAFICAKGIKAVGRFSDIALFLFLLPFIGLLVFSLEEAEFSGLLPLFEQPFQNSLSAVRTTLPHFLDTAVLLPLLARIKPQKTDGKKILGGYALGCAFTLLFLAVFYAVYSTIAFKEHYAFSKIAQYFPALATVGRIDLLLVYILCIPLFFYTALPLFYAVDCIATTFSITRKSLLSGAVSLLAFVFTLFFNKYYNAVYALYTQKLFWLFLIFGCALPLALFFIKRKSSYAN